MVLEGKCVDINWGVVFYRWVSYSGVFQYLLKAILIAHRFDSEKSLIQGKLKGKIGL
jgi:hypothetical protein